MLLLVICVSVVIAGSAALPPTVGPTCEYEGVTYNDGDEWYPDQCSPPCMCQGGMTLCAVYSIWCPPTPCVDPVPDTTPCSVCHICPNGVNCEARDGTVITGTDPVQTDPFTTCWCDGSTPWAVCVAELNQQ